jgi:hypothetical protein
MQQRLNAETAQKGMVPERVPGTDPSAVAIIIRMFIRALSEV